jgi:hypothetical protein
MKIRDGGECSFLSEQAFVLSDNSPGVGRKNRIRTAEDRF